MSKQEDVLRKVEELSPEEQKRLFAVLLRKLAVPLQDPAAFFDDWDDPKVDRAYEEMWP